MRSRAKKTIKELPKVEKSLIEEYEMAGHRKRLRNRFLQGGLDGFLDYEIVELLLTLGTPRKNCKQIAKQAIKKFGGLQGVLDASLEELQQIKGIGPHNIFGIKLFQAISERYAKGKIPAKILMNSPCDVADYLQRKIGREKKEHFVILYLNTRNDLIVNNVSIGTLNASLVHPREVFKGAVHCHAAQVVIAHNHPSGNTEPSEDDLTLTRRLVEAGKILGIEVVDHVIVTNKAYFSFKEKGLI
jgi:DNA repair protein RadC